jgi:beta-lactam-binding protein with PASTA domain
VGGGGGGGGSSFVPAGGKLDVIDAPARVSITYTRCVVPALVGKRLAQAELLLQDANCGVGAVHRPKSCSGHLVVTRQGLKAGTVHLVGTKVDLTAVCRAD